MSSSAINQHPGDVALTGKTLNSTRVTELPAPAQPLGNLELMS